MSTEESYFTYDFMIAGFLMMKSKPVKEVIMIGDKPAIVFHMSKREGAAMSVAYSNSEFPRFDEAKERAKKLLFDLRSNGSLGNRRRRANG